jgi:hypothetical protein
VSGTKKALILLAVVAILFALTWIPHGGGSARSSRVSTAYTKGQSGGGPLATFGRLTDHGTTVDTSRMKSRCGGGGTLIVLPGAGCALTLTPTTTKTYQFLKLKVVTGLAATVSYAASGKSSSGSKSLGADSSTTLPIGSDGGTVTIVCAGTVPCVLSIVRST